MGKYDDAIGSVELKISVNDILNEAPWEAQKYDLIGILNQLERELTDLALVPGAEADTRRALLLTKHVKWAIRDGEQIDMDKISEELRSL